MRRSAELLGPQKYREQPADKKNEVGATVGLGVDRSRRLDSDHRSRHHGRPRPPTTTGKLGDVMQESAQAAMSYLRSRSHEMNLPRDFYRHVDIHLHVPEGAIPKDGPSAGITIATSITSALTSIPVRADLAMTGEITVRGKVLPIGGLKEKLLAAHRHGIRVAILPADNERDLPDIPENIRKDMKLHFVTSMDEVLKLALEREIEMAPPEWHAECCGDCGAVPRRENYALAAHVERLCLSSAGLGDTSPVHSHARPFYNECSPAGAVSAGSRT